jgi:hypothetical protein
VEQVVNSTKKTIVICAEVALVLVILALIAANWIPIIVGAHPMKAPQ